MPQADFSDSALAAFTDTVWKQGQELYRDLPWRRIDDPYQVLVSEVMLQQTQVARVLKYWERFIAHFPTIDALASAENTLMLELWQGLGYNRRALNLKKAAELCACDYSGVLPNSYQELLALPGIGAATAAGVRIFAHNQPEVYIETNVRTVFIHELFPDVESVSDKMLSPLVEATCCQNDPRSWYYALLDYGVYLKQQVSNPSRKSTHYARQSTFEGSRRQKRAELLRTVLAFPGIERSVLKEHLDVFEKQRGRKSIEQTLFDSLLNDMLKEGFFRNEDEHLFA